MGKGSIEQLWEECVAVLLFLFINISLVYTNIKSEILNSSSKEKQDLREVFQNWVQVTFRSCLMLIHLRKLGSCVHFFLLHFKHIHIYYLWPLMVLSPTMNLKYQTSQKSLLQGHVQKEGTLKEDRNSGRRPGFCPTFWTLASPKARLSK